MTVWAEHAVCPSPAQSYRHVEPQLWTVDNVLEWISDHVESNKLDARSLSLALCSVDGFSLCQMCQGQMCEVFGPQLGAQLYQSLQEHKSSHGKPLPPAARGHTLARR